MLLAKFSCNLSHNKVALHSAATNVDVAESRSDVHYLCAEAVMRVTNNLKLQRYFVARECYPYYLTFTEYRFCVRKKIDSDLATGLLCSPFGSKRLKEVAKCQGLFLFGLSVEYFHFCKSRYQRLLRFSFILLMICI